MSRRTVNSTLELALGFLEAHPHWYIFPLLRGTKGQPLIKDNLNLASNDPAQITAWHTQYPGCGWGLALGKSGVVVVDIDTKPGKYGDMTWFDLETLHGDAPKTLTVKTPSGGLHHYFAVMDNRVVRIKLGSSGFGPDVDVPNYVVIPGVKVSAGTYHVIEDLQLAPVPEWFWQYIGDDTASSHEAVDQIPVTEQDTPAIIERAIHYLKNDAPSSIEGQNGERTLALVAATLKDMGVSEPMCVELLAEHYNKLPEGGGKCDPVWLIGEGPDADRLDVKVHNAYTYFTQNAPGADDPKAQFEAEPPTQDDIAAKAKHDARKEQVKEAVEAVRSRPENEKEVRYSLAEICEQWVWIAQFKRFVNRTIINQYGEPLTLDKEAFNDRFRYLKGDASSVANLLMGRTEDTIRKLNGIEYVPNAAEFHKGMWNQWKPSSILPKPGDTKLFHQHLAYIFPEQRDRELLLDWMAGVLQHPATKPRHQLAILGRIQGTGKSFFARLMAALIGEANSQTLTQDILEAGFTGWAMRTKLVVIEEVRDVSSSKKSTSKLHTWASERSITINQKNLPTFVMAQSIAFIIMSNKDDALSLDNSDRRYLVLRTLAKVHPEKKAYYDRLYGVHGVGGTLNDPAALGAILHELLHRKLADGYSIEGAAPYTMAKDKLILDGSSEVAQWMADHDGLEVMDRMVIDPDEIFEQLPRYMQRSGAMRQIREALAERFKMVPWPQQIRPDGRRGGKVRVWLNAPKWKAMKLKAVAESVLRFYRDERKQFADQCASTAPEDFGEE